MSDPIADLAALDDATDRLLADAATLDAAALAAPSRLPGWSRGHVLAHLSRNADALVNVLQGRPMYASAEARDADIERGAGRSPEAQREDLRASADRLRQAAAQFEGEQWRRTVELRNGVTDQAGAIPFRRRVEVELHHVDLGIGRTVADLPGSFTDRALPYLAARFSGHRQVPPLELRAEDGRSWTTGHADGPRLVVAGVGLAGVVVWVLKWPVSFRRQVGWRLRGLPVGAANADEDRFPPREVMYFMNGQKEEGIRPREVRVTDETTKGYVELYSAYEEQCQREGVVDFAELLLRCYELLARNEILREHYCQRFRHILVD
jgi:maleylpyruvate isomerase